MYTAASLVSVHTRDPRLEAVKRTDIQRPAGDMFTSFVLSIAPVYNVPRGCLWSDCDGWPIFGSCTWAILLAQVEKHVVSVVLHQIFPPGFSGKRLQADIYTYSNHLCGTVKYFEDCACSLPRRGLDEESCTTHVFTRNIVSLPGVSPG